MLKEAIRDAGREYAESRKPAEKSIVMTPDEFNNAIAKATDLAVTKHDEFLIETLSRVNSEAEREPDEAVEEMNEMTNRVGKAYEEGIEFNNPCPHCGYHVPLDKPAENLIDHLNDEIRKISGDMEAIGKALAITLQKLTDLEENFDNRIAEQTAYLVQKATPQAAITPRFGLAPQETETLMTGLRQQPFTPRVVNVSDAVILKAINTYDRDQLMSMAKSACKTPADTSKAEYVIEQLDVVNSDREAVAILKSLPPAALTEITKGGN